MPDRLAGLQHSLATSAATAESADGHVRAEVNARGHILALRIDESAMVNSAEVLAREIVRAVSTAHDRAQGAVRAELDRFRSHPLVAADVERLDTTVETTTVETLESATDDADDQFQQASFLLDPLGPR